MTTPAPDFRKLCAELVDSLENARRIIQGGDGTLHINTAEFVLRRARSALATPPPEPPTEPPTDDELNALWNCCGDHDEEGDHYGNIFQFARAVIKRWGAK